MSVTLPYPSMNFVPLDILTAEELNHMAANDQYLAGLFPVSTANVADGAITNAKLGTLTGVSATNSSGNVDISATRSDSSTTISLRAGDSSAHGVYSNKLGKWLIQGDASGATLGDGVKVLNGWRSMGCITAENEGELVIDLGSNADPYGLIVLASVEHRTSSTGGYWVDIQMRDASGNILTADGQWVQCWGGTVSGQSNTAVNFTMAGATDAAYKNIQFFGSSIRSNAENYRSWQWQSGSPVCIRSGSSVQTSNTGVAKIAVVLSVVGNISLEVWYRAAA